MQVFDGLFVFTRNLMLDSSVIRVGDVRDRNLIKTIQHQYHRRIAAISPSNCTGYSSELASRPSNGSSRMSRSGLAVSARINNALRVSPDDSLRKHDPAGAQS